MQCNLFNYITQTKHCSQLLQYTNEILIIWYFVYLHILFIYLTVEMATLTRENNKSRIRILPQHEVGVLIKKFEEEEEVKAEAAKKEKEKEKSAGKS